MRYVKRYRTTRTPVNPCKYFCSFPLQLICQLAEPKANLVLYARGPALFLSRAQVRRFHSMVDDACKHLASPQSRPGEDENEDEDDDSYINAMLAASATLDNKLTFVMDSLFMMGYAQLRLHASPVDLTIYEADVLQNKLDRCVEMMDMQDADGVYLGSLVAKEPWHLASGGCVDPEGQSLCGQVAPPSPASRYPLRKWTLDPFRGSPNPEGVCPRCLSIWEVLHEVGNEDEGDLVFPR